MRGGDRRLEHDGTGGEHMERRDFLVGTLSSMTCVAAAGCLTARLYDTEYNETALSFLVTEDGSRLVVLGKQHHYIFHDIPPSLKEILLGQLRTVVVADLSNFYVRTDNVVTGDYTLSMSEGASDEQRRSAIEAGFTGPRLALSGHLEGVRYSAEGFPSTAHTQEFTRPYVVTIREQESGAKIAGKILLTPVTVAADGALILGGFVLLIILLPLTKVTS
jgi:hypothetical protein